MNTKSAIFLIFICSVALVSTLQFSNELENNPHMKALFLQMESKMKMQGGVDGSVGFATVVAIIQRLIESAEKKQKEYASVIKNQTDSCLVSTSDYEKKVNITKKNIDKASAEILKFQGAVMNTTVLLKESKYEIENLKTNISEVVDDYVLYNQTKIGAIYTLKKAISTTTDLLGLISFITSTNSVKDQVPVMNKADIEKYKLKVQYLINNIQNFTSIAEFFSFQNSSILPDNIRELDTNIDNAKESKAFFLNTRIQNINDVLSIILTSIENGQDWDNLFNTRISNLNNVLHSHVNYEKTLAKNLEFYKINIDNTQKIKEKLLAYLQNIEKLILAQVTWCQSSQKNLKNLKDSFEADLILYAKIKKYFFDNFNKISNKIKEEFKGNAEGAAASSLSRTKSTTTYKLNTKTTQTTQTTTPKALSRTKTSTSTYKIDTKTTKTTSTQVKKPQKISKTGQKADNSQKNKHKKANTNDKADKSGKKRKDQSTKKTSRNEKPDKSSKNKPADKQAIKFTPTKPNPIRLKPSEKTEKKSKTAGTGGVDKKPAKTEKKQPNKNKGDSKLSGPTKKTETL